MTRTRATLLLIPVFGLALTIPASGGGDKKQSYPTIGKITRLDPGLDKLLEDKVSLGADASLAAGPVGRSASAATDAQLHAEILSYSHSSGLLAGIDLSGGVLRADKDADTRAYGPGAMPREVVNGGRGLLSPAAARPFLEALAAEVDHPAANN